MKKCYKCKKNKIYDCFSKQKDKKDGFSGICKICCNIKGKQYRENNKEKNKKRHKIYTLNNKEKIQKYHRQYYRLNKQKYYENNKKWANNNRQKMRELWRKNACKPETKHRRRINEARRRATKLKATPNWLTIGQLEEIKKIYNNCPIGHHVDHVIPLRGKIVCGLHVPWNLQYLTKLENVKKNNKVIL